MEIGISNGGKTDSRKAMKKVLTVIQMREVSGWAWGFLEWLEERKY